MNRLNRFGVSIEEDLLARFDDFIVRKEYPNRSEAIRDIIREKLISERVSGAEGFFLGSLTLVYGHHEAKMLSEMAEIQHAAGEIIASVMHLHVSHDDCMEILALRGDAREIRRLADRLISLKGIKHGELFLSLPSSAI